MTMLEDDTLRRMALGRTQERPAPARPFPEVATRARRIRRTRALVASGLTAGASGALALTLTVTGVPVGAGSRAGGDVTLRPTRTATPAAVTSGTATSGTATSGTDAQACTSGFSAAVGFERVPALLRLPPAAVAGDPLVLSFARDTTFTCAPPPTAALWYAMTGDTVSARMQVDGPGAADPYDHPGGAFGGRITTETIGDRTVRVYDMLDAYDHPWTMYFWTEPDGTGWWADVQGLDGRAARAAVAGLRIDGARVDPGSQPGPLPQRGSGGASRPADGHLRYFYAAYKNENEDAGGWAVEIGDSTGLGWQAAVGARRVDVGGVTGWSSGPKGMTNLSWEAADGDLYQVHGRLRPAKALRVARSLRHVAPDDPRLVASRETPAPTDTATSPSATSTLTPVPTPSG